MVRKDQISPNPTPAQNTLLADNDPYKIPTKKQLRFIKEYMVDMNGTQAAIRAGYSKNGTKVIASQLLTKLNIKRLIDIEIEKLNIRLEITADRTIQEVARIATFDPRKLYRNGRLLNVWELDDDTAACIGGIKHTTIYPKDKDLAKKIIVEFKIWDKNSALDKLMRIQQIGQPVSQIPSMQPVQDNRTYIQINTANLSDDEVKVAGKLLGMDADEDVRKLEQFECIGKQQATG
ncbi:MAG: terminase small subunit [Desulfobacula sp.]|nr:terminase small subunit [Desulfobacula sp.]